jgi:hypothetical protein
MRALMPQIMILRQPGPITRRVKAFAASIERYRAKP